MAYNPPHRDKKFNPYLQRDGSLNFKDFFKRPEVETQLDPLAIILAGLDREQNKGNNAEEVKKIVPPCRLYVSFIQSKSKVNSAILSVNQLYLKLEPPLPIDNSTSANYHGYELVRTDEGITARRYKETQLHGTWRIKPFGKTKPVLNGKLLEELLQQAETKQIKIKDYVSKPVVRSLYGLWHS